MPVRPVSDRFPPAQHYVAYIKFMSQQDPAQRALSCFRPPKENWSRSSSSPTIQRDKIETRLAGPSLRHNNVDTPSCLRRVNERDDLSWAYITKVSFRRHPEEQRLPSWVEKKTRQWSARSWPGLHVVGAKATRKLGLHRAELHVTQNLGEIRQIRAGSEK